MAGMTRYSVDSDARRNAVLAVAAVSVAGAIAINVTLMPHVEVAFGAAGLGDLYAALNGAGILGSVGTLGLYGALWALFDTVLWKRGPLIGIHGIPDLNGAWVGEGISNYEVEGEPVRYDMKLDITQTFSKMECKSKFTNSESANHIIGIHGCNPARRSCTLEFSYRNEAREKAVVDEGWDCEHKGCSWIECEGDSMFGRYFTNRKEPTRGTFSLTRTPNAQLTQGDAPQS